MVRILKTIGVYLLLLAGIALFSLVFAVGLACEPWNGPLHICPLENGVTLQPSEMKENR